MSFLHNEIFVIGEKAPQHENLPQFYDVVFLPMPESTRFDETGFVLSYKGMVVDYGTGTYADFLLSPKPVAIYKLGIETHSRKEYNRILDYIFTVEGRYLSFWTTTHIPQFLPCGYGPDVFPTMESFDSFGGTEQYFYAVNWGQAESWNESEKLVLIFTDGYTKCHWNKVESVEQTPDYRILKVNLAHPLPELQFSQVDLITDGVYVRANKDEIQFEAITSTIFEISFEFIEDVSNYYDPWQEEPKIYPKEDEG